VRDLPFSGAPVVFLLIVGIGLAAVAVGAFRIAARAGDVSGRIQSARDALSQRLGPVGAFALIMAMGLVISSAAALLLGLLGKVDVIHHADATVVHYLAAHRAGWLTRPLLTITQIGSYQTSYTTALVAGAVLSLLCQSWLPLPLLFASVVVEKYMQQFLGALVDGGSPPRELAVGERGTFPSGGSARTVIVFGLTAWLIARARPGSREAATSWTLVASLAFVEGWSRLYLGRHWVADVVGGWVWGALLLATLTLAMGALGSASGRQSDPDRRSAGARQRAGHF
jgi:membrane-associated phospholipid phosphatase